MNSNEIKTAAKKYGPAYKKNAEAAQLEMISDEYSEDEIKLVVAEILGPLKTVAEKQANHPTCKWYDEFECRIQKMQVQNVIAGKSETIITGWELTKKLMPKFIEPSVAKQLNVFANGMVPENIGLMLILKGSKNVGSTITYKEWADEMGINPANDLNQLLTKALL